jgi:hypothetical protein
MSKHAKLNPPVPIPTVWDDNAIQFPRLIAELEAAGAITPKVMGDLATSMDLRLSEVRELIDRACDEFDRIKETL